MQIPDIIHFITTGGIILIFKIPLLVLIFLYMLFLLIILSRLKAFDRIVQIPASGASSKLRLLAAIQLALAISLFFLTLVIV